MGVLALYQMQIGYESTIFSLRNIRLGKTNMSAQTRLVNSSNEPWFNVFGPLHQYLVAPADVSGAFPLMRAIIPPGIPIPLPIHPDPTFSSFPNAPLTS